jgi:hypothetical protein
MAGVLVMTDTEFYLKAGTYTRTNIIVPIVTLMVVTVKLLWVLALVMLKYALIVVVKCCNFLLSYLKEEECSKDGSTTQQKHEALSSTKEGSPDTTGAPAQICDAKCAPA